MVWYASLVQLFVRQVAVLRRDARSVVLKLVAQPAVAEVASIGATGVGGTVLVQGQAAQVGEACPLEGELHGVLVAQKVLHGVDVVFLGYFGLI